jgi:outer membrane lipoprotein-sorting protein
MNFKRASMNKVNVFRLICVALFLFSSAGYSADEPVKKLQAFLKSSKSLTADFKRVILIKPVSGFFTCNDLENFVGII